MKVFRHLQSFRLLFRVAAFAALALGFVTHAKAALGYGIYMTGEAGLPNNWQAWPDLSSTNTFEGLAGTGRTQDTYETIAGRAVTKQLFEVRNDTTDVISFDVAVAINETWSADGSVTIQPGATQWILGDVYSDGVVREERAAYNLRRSPVGPPTVTLTTETGGSGTGTISPAGKTTYNVGASVTVIAEGTNGSTLGKIEVYVNSTVVATYYNSPVTMTMDSNKYVFASFDPPAPPPKPPVVTITAPTAPVRSGDTYAVSASATDENKDLVTLTIAKNTQPFSASGSSSNAAADISGTSTDAGPATITYVATARDGGGLVSTATATVTVLAPPVTASITANPTTAVAPGSSTISWSSTNASSVAVSGPGLSTTEKTGSYNATGLAEGTHTYTITAQGTDGPVTRTATVTVSAAPTVTASISANPTTAPTPDTSTISWNTEHATTVSVKGPGIDSSAATGSQTLTNLAAGTYTYVLTAAGPSGSVTRTAVVTVGENGSVPKPVSATIIADPSLAVAPGVSTISWNAQNATSVTVTGPNLTTSSASVGSQSVSGLAVGTHTYTIVAEGKNGPVTRTATVTVSAAPSPIVTAAISASPTTGASAPGSTTITWSSTNATSVSVTGTTGTNFVTSTAASGTQTVTGLPNGSHTFTIVAQGNGGPATRTVSVTVGTIGGTADATIKATPTQAPFEVWATSTISWTTKDAVSATIVGPGVSSTALNGSAVVRATDIGYGSHKYTITARDASGQFVERIANLLITGGEGRNTSFRAEPEFTPWTGGTVAFRGDSSMAGPGWISVFHSDPATGVRTYLGTMSLNIGVGTDQLWGTWELPATTSTRLEDFTATFGSYDQYGGSASADFHQYAAPTPTAQTVTITPTSRTAAPGATLTFTASGGTTGYVWSGVQSANGSTGTFTVPANAAGGDVLTVSVYSPAAVVGGVNWGISNTATATITVEKIVPTITWANPSPITYGTPLSSTQLNATANVPGTFTHTPASGAVLNAGTHTLSVVFTPADTGAYSNATATVTLTVNRATPSVTWNRPAPINYGTALSGTQLNATANVPGSFAYTPAAGVVLNAGSNSLSTTFAPQDSTNYNSVTASVPITVNKVAAVISWATPAPIKYGMALSGTQLNATANTVGTFTYAPATGTVLKAGTHTLAVIFSPQDSMNYTAATANVDLIVEKPVVTFTPVASSYTVRDPSSPLNGQTYPRMWREGDSWSAYLGRSGVKFNVKGFGHPAVQAVEIEARSPSAVWTKLAAQNPGDATTVVDLTFDVMLDKAAPTNPLMPNSYADGAPLTGTWMFRARIQSSNGEWGDFSPEVPVSVILPISTKAVAGQTVPPAGDLGKWFTASPVQTYSVQIWIP